MATSTSTKTLLTLVAPAALVLAVTCTALLVAPASPLLGRAADGYPLIVMATCVLLAWRLLRSRLLILALLAACAAVALEPRLYGSSAAVAMVVATTLPLGLALLSATADRPISAPRAYLQLLLAALPTVTVLLLLVWAPGQVLPILEYDVLAIGPTRLSQVSVLAGTLAVLVAGLFARLRRRPADAGGEEFTIVFPGKSKAEALPHVQAVRESIEQSKFTLRTLPRPRGQNAAAARGTKSSRRRQLGVTISAGLASYSSANESPQAVVKSADKAMYRAKKNGRNRVVA